MLANLGRFLERRRLCEIAAIGSSKARSQRSYDLQQFLDRHLVLWIGPGCRSHDILQLPVGLGTVGMLVVAADTGGGNRDVGKHRCVSPDVRPVEELWIAGRADSPKTFVLLDSKQVRLHDRSA